MEPSTPGGANEPREVSDWQIVRSEVLVDSPWLRVQRQLIRSTSGYEIPEYYVLDAPDIVGLVALTKKRELILVQQFRHGIRANTLELPTGLIDPRETPRTAAGRELLEETGYRAGRLEALGRIFPSPARQSNATYPFLAFDCEPVGPGGGDPSENISLRLLSLPDARAAARNGELASQGSLACLLLGLERLRELGLD